jgi:hypothetical protein
VAARPISFRKRLDQDSCQIAVFLRFTLNNLPDKSSDERQATVNVLSGNGARTRIAPGKLCWTAISPLPRAAMYGGDEAGSAPMPETWISCSTPLACEVGHARRGLDMHGIEGDAATLDL